MEKWTHTQLFHSGDGYYAALADNIRSAKKSITLETYIFTVDKITRVLLDELAAARKRGCSVQVLVDGVGSYNSLVELNSFFSLHDIELRVYHPLLYSTGWFRHFFLLNFIIQFFLIFKRVNRRNHRKITIIDGKKAFLGSLNFSETHSEKARGAKAWRDTGISVEGSPVTRFTQAFLHAWRYSQRRGFRRLFHRYKETAFYHPRTSLVRLNITPRMRYRVYRDLIRRIRQAKTRIFVTSAYFLPKGSLLRALKFAARKGVKVEIIVPGVTDVPLVRWAAFEIATNLVKSGIEIFEYQERILHAKYMIIDDYCSIGSLNLNHRSLLHDLEVEAVLDTDADRLNLLQQWGLDLENSQSLTEQKLKSNSWWIRCLSRIAFKLRYLL